MEPQSLITLRSGAAVLDLLPEVGGAVGRFRVDSIDVLRPAPPGTRDPLTTASFPLVPFANRIAFGVFDFGGETICLPRNFGDHPHVLHGHGWKSPWRLEELQPDRATLSYDHAADAWPWSYKAHQIFTLAPRELHIALVLTNTSSRPMPASLGFHPYFPKHPRTLLQASVEGVWLSDPTGIPTEQAGRSRFLDLAAGAQLDTAPFVDHCHFGWAGEAVIEQPDHRIVLRASSNLRFLHCFVPVGADVFCAEPMSAMPDAVHRSTDDSGLTTVLPGQSLAASVRIGVEIC